MCTAFATVGAPVELGAIAAAAILAYLARRNGRSFFLTAAAMLLVAAFAGVWVGLIRPVNARTAGWTVETIPADWEHWRAQWEYSHTARFVLHLTAFCALLVSILSRSPGELRVMPGGSQQVRGKDLRARAARLFNEPLNGPFNAPSKHREGEHNATQPRTHRGDA